jgi:hypothetical protein
VAVFGPPRHLSYAKPTTAADLRARYTGRGAAREEFLRISVYLLGRARERVSEDEDDRGRAGLAGAAEAIWVVWWNIAEEHALTARRAVGAAGGAIAPDEHDPSMIALIATASAIEGLALTR